MTQEEQPSVDFVALSADIVAAFVSHNRVVRTELPDLIATVHRSLTALVKAPEPPAPVQEPAVPVRKSITPDYLISLEDGKSYRSLKRHLTAQGLTPELYRAKWGLPRDYPMVAPNYAKRRSELAKSIGLGQMRTKDKPEAAAPEPEPETPAPAPRKGRSRRTGTEG